MSAAELAIYTARPPAIRAAQRFLEVQHGAIARRLAPFGLPAERFTALVLTEVAKSEQLQRCMESEKGQVSLQLAMFELAQHGLEPGPLGHAYLIPFWNKRERYMKATAIFGWKGIVQLVLRHPDVREVDVQPVYLEDEFRVVRGTRKSIVHVPRYEGPPDYDRLTHVYAVCHTRNGGRPFTVLSKTRVEYYRAMSQQPDGEAWTKHPVPMACKTAVRHGYQAWPLLIAERAAIVAEEERELALGEEGESGVAPLPPPRLVAGRDRRRPASSTPPPPDPPAPPGPGAATTEAPPPDAPAEPPPSGPPASTTPPPDVPPEPGGASSMTPAQYLAMVCREAGVDHRQLLRALTGKERARDLSADEVRQCTEVAREIKAGRMRFQVVDGVMSVVEVQGRDG